MENLNGNIEKMVLRAETSWNFSYFPIKLSNEKECVTIIEKLNEANIFPRRYFKPSLNELPYLQPSSCPISEDTASRILCLPLYSELQLENVKQICKMINECL